MPAGRKARDANRDESPPKAEGETAKLLPGSKNKTPPFLVQNISERFRKRYDSFIREILIFSQ